MSRYCQFEILQKIVSKLWCQCFKYQLLPASLFFDSPHFLRIKFDNVQTADEDYPKPRRPKKKSDNPHAYGTRGNQPEDDEEEEAEDDGGSGAETEEDELIDWHSTSSSDR